MFFSLFVFFSFCLTQYAFLCIKGISFSSPHALYEFNILYLKASSKSFCQNGTQLYVFFWKPWKDDLTEWFLLDMNTVYQEKMQSATQWKQKIERWPMHPHCCKWLSSFECTRVTQRGRCYAWLLHPFTFKCTKWVNSWRNALYVDYYYRIGSL